jgi:hypothetical protein
MLRICIGVFALICAPLFFGCKNDSGPEPGLTVADLVGTWENGINIVEFRANGSFSFDGEVTIPGQSTIQVKVEGTIRSEGGSLFHAIPERVTMLPDTVLEGEGATGFEGNVIISLSTDTMAIRQEELASPIAVIAGSYTRKK